MLAFVPPDIVGAWAFCFGMSVTVWLPGDLRGATGARLPPSVAHWVPISLLNEYLLMFCVPHVDTLSPLIFRKPYVSPRLREKSPGQFCLMRPCAPRGLSDGLTTARMPQSHVIAFRLTCVLHFDGLEGTASQLLALAVAFHSTRKRLHTGRSQSHPTFSVQCNAF
uniref:Uncharacterized protein TCIL3000_8_1470 n=1 Tax=Trypanosoma congolense (strain IL3000) TaxID=1068625 RepID=G0URB8_TRYCI|nr:unnamed protein product [Trypanosoma congolense IL3000]